MGCNQIRNRRDKPRLARDVLIHSFSGDRKLSRYLKAHSEPGILRQVHPLNSPTIRWPPHKTMSENEAFELADRYTHILIQSQQTSPNQSIIPLGQGVIPKCDHNGCANFSYRRFQQSNGRVEWYCMDHAADGGNGSRDLIAAAENSFRR